MPANYIDTYALSLSDLSHFEAAPDNSSAEFQNSKQRSAEIRKRYQAWWREEYLLIFSWDKLIIKLLVYKVKRWNRIMVAEVLALIAI